LASLGRLLVGHAKDEIAVQVRARIEESDRHAPVVPKDAIGPQVALELGKSGGHGPPAAKDQIRADACSSGVGAL
jgi:hypothetical protein